MLWNCGRIYGRSEPGWCETGAAWNQYKNYKIGTELLKELIKMAKKEKIEFLTLEVNVNNKIAINLYKKYNFKEVGTRKKYYKGLDDATIMTLKLDS